MLREAAQPKTVDDGPGALAPWRVIHLRGELDCAQAGSVRAMIDAALSGPPPDAGPLTTGPLTTGRLNATALEANALDTGAPAVEPLAPLGAGAPGGGCPRIAIDLSEVSFCDSYGLSLLVYAAKRVRERDGVLLVANASRQVRALIERCGLQRLLVLTP